MNFFNLCSIGLNSTSLNVFQSQPDQNSDFENVTSMAMNLFAVCYATHQLYQFKKTYWRKLNEDSAIQISGKVKGIRGYVNSAYLMLCKNASLNGKYIVKHIDGEIWRGNFFNERLHGEGEKIFSLEAGIVTQRGTFVNGELHGEGEIEFSNGKFYRGMFVNGVLYGEGEKEYAKGYWIKREQGSFVNGFLHGFGERILSNGEILEGDFIEGEFNKGRICFQNGDIYRGLFAHRKLILGEVFLLNGDYIKGYFDNGSLNGKGKVILHNKVIIKGNFVEGKLNGMGEITYPAEWSEIAKEKGIFKEGLLHGEGSRIYGNGRIEKGLFEWGNSVRTTEEEKNEIFSVPNSKESSSDDDLDNEGYKQPSFFEENSDCHPLKILSR